MKRKLLLLASLIFLIDILLIIILPKMGLIVLLSMIICIVILGGILILNNIYLYTNNWKNRFVFKHKFLSGKDYRIDHGRNYEIINLGSNPAYFGFFYEKVRGQNWSTGSQGFDMDFEILKLYHSYLRKFGYVLIPIMPFSAVSPYIKTKKDYWNDVYYLKFASILDEAQIEELPEGKKLKIFLKYPLIFKPQWVKYLLIDNPIDERLNIDFQTMSKVELEFDATRMVNSWLKEFDACNLDDFLSDRYNVYVYEAQKTLDEMIQYCVDRSYNPVLITIPMSRELSMCFSAEFHKKMVNDFVGGLKHKDIKFLDYMIEEDYQNDNFFNGSFYMNLSGRKRFTNQVLRDLGI